MKVVIVGAGRMGRRHIEVIRRNGLDIVGLCDRREEALKASETECNIDRSIQFRDLSSVLQQTRPQVVIVATTAPSHCEIVWAAAQAGTKYILCEKPMAVSLDECDRMIDICEANNCALAINHQMRFMELYVTPKEMLAAKSFGGLKSMTVIGGNFGLAMNGSHYLEAFRFLTDSDPIEVSASFSAEPVANPRGAEFEDRAGTIRLVNAHGQRFYMDASSDQGHGMFVVYAAANGQITVDEGLGVLSSCVREEQYRELPTTRYLMPATNESQVIAPVDAIGPSAAVLQALVRGGDVPTGAHGRLTLNVLVAAHVSHERHGEPVRLDDPAIDRTRTFAWA